MKKPIAHRACKYYAFNPSVCACECDKDCEIDEHVKNCTCMTSLIDDLLIKFDEIADTTEIASIDSIKKQYIK